MLCIVCTRTTKYNLSFHLQDGGVGEQLDLEELRDVADNITHFVVQHDDDTLLMCGAFGTLRLGA